MSLDEFLIAAQFGCMIASDRLMEIAGLILIECVAGKVEHTIIE